MNIWWSNNYLQFSRVLLNWSIINRWLGGAVHCTCPPLAQPIRDDVQRPRKTRKDQQLLKTNKVSTSTAGDVIRKGSFRDASSTGIPPDPFRFNEPLQPRMPSWRHIRPFIARIRVASDKRPPCPRNIPTTHKKAVYVTESYSYVLGVLFFIVVDVTCHERPDSMWSFSPWY